MKGCLITLAIIFSLFVGLMMIGNTDLPSGATYSAPPAPSTSKGQVSLRPAPGNSIVQMFERVGAGNEGRVTQFPSGTRCTVMEQPKGFTVEGVAMRFWRLNCNGTTGYVNAKWVQ
jgi:hypothetical protein